MDKFPYIFDDENFHCVLKGSGENSKGVSVCIHGDETAGLDAIQRIVETDHDRSKYKYLHLIGGNPRAYAAKKRFLEANLNRVHGDPALIPTDMLNSYERRVAERLEPIFRKCDQLMDVHQSFSDDDFIVCKEDSLPLAKSMASPRIMISPETKHYTDPKHAVVSSTDHFMNAIGKQGIVYEFGDMRNEDQTNNINKAFDEILNFVTEKSSPNTTETVEVYRTKVVYVTQKHYIAEKSSIPFSPLETGQVIGHDGGEPIIVSKEQDGLSFMLGFPEQPIPGQEAFMMGKKTIESRN